MIAVVGVLSASISAVAVAQTAPPPKKEAELKEVTVTATRQAKPADEVAATVSVITDADKEKALATDIRDLVRYEPGVSVRSSPSRFTLAGAATGRDGNAGFTIRGIGGNQILMQADGIRLPLAFSFGGQNFGRGDYLDLELYKSVEIVRGPASALYGSDGLAGAVSFMTKDPSDFVKKDGELFGSLKWGMTSVDKSRQTTGTFAARAGDISLMLVATRREFEEPRNKATNDAPNSTRTTPNPQDGDQDSGLLKVVFQPNAAHRFKLTAEKLDRFTRTEGFSAVAPPPLAATSVIGFIGEDTLTRERGSINYDFTGKAGSVFEKAGVMVYEQRTRNRALGLEDRSTAADRVRDSQYSERVHGINTQASGKWVMGNVLHQFVYGLDYSDTRVTGVQDGLVPAFGETFPLKRFPDTDYELTGAFVLNEVMLTDTFSLTPGLRYDKYKLEPRQGDAQFSDPAPKGLSDSAFTPRIGAVWKFMPALSAYAQVAKGFRSPTPAQVNNGFTNQLSFYQSIANPDLKPESSETFEFGVRGAGARWNFDAVAFSSRYKDFILMAQIGGNFTATNPAVFQNVNVSRVRISGFEAKGKFVIGNGFSLMGSYAQAKGDDKSANAPLDTIDPAKLVIGGEYSQGSWGVQLVGTAVKTKDRLPASATPGVPLFASPSYRTLDAFGYWSLGKQLSVNLAAFNLTDQKYWVWQDVRGLLANSTVLDAYTQAGRSYALTMKATF